MIIVGYQGIGKSTLANKSPLFIDLESSNFFIKNEETGEMIRDKNWYIPYCNIAVHLNQQGKHVFVSSHKEVRDRLIELDEKSVISCTPSLDFKDIWITKLRHRYLQSKLEKDYKAWKNAEARYEENIKEILHDIKHNITIETMDYDLEDILTKVINRNTNDKWNDIFE